MERVRKLSSGSYLFEVSTVDDDGANATAHAPYTVTIADGAGETVASGVPTHHDHLLQFNVPAATITRLDTYTATWTATVGGVITTWVSEVEVVGGYLFEVADLRSFDRMFADATKYPTKKLRRARTWVENTIEGHRAANVAFVPRSRRVALNGTGPDPLLGFNPLLYGSDYRSLMAPDYELRDVYSVAVDGTPFTADELADVRVDDNLLYRSSGVVWPKGRRNISVHYTHGYDRPPGAIIRAALTLAREYLVQSDLPGRATATSIGDQMFRLTIAGRDGVTGIPDVDAAIDQFGRKSFGIG